MRLSRAFKHSNTFFLLAGGYIFQFQWQIAKIKIIVRILSAQLKLINLSSSKNHGDLGRTHDIKHSIFSQGSFASLTLKLGMENI